MRNHVNDESHLLHLTIKNQKSLPFLNKMTFFMALFNRDILKKRQYYMKENLCTSFEIIAHFGVALNVNKIQLQLKY